MTKLSLTAALPLVIALPFAQLACESAQDTSGPSETTAVDDPQSSAFGHCTYVNKFSKAEECREYQGSAWTEESVRQDCEGQNGELSDGACSYDTILGTCILGDEAQQTIVIAPGEDASKCSGNKLGCETFGGGAWIPEAPCKGEVTGEPGGTVYQPAELICKEPLPGEPSGQSADGKVCTWGAIAACTEPGRKFVDYASCEPVYTQRPYYPSPAPPSATDPDPRMDDPEYVKELDWVKEQVEACACVCCHQDSITPGGAGVWDIESKGNWANSFTSYGLAFAGGFIESWPLGAYSSEENNGFDRSVTGLPTTDIARMQAFFKGELEHRGKSVDDYKDYDPTPAFFYEQHTYEPAACEAGEGVAKDGVVTWAGGSARYVYVLEAGADNPGVPPNLDVPAGTVWKLDVHPDSAARKSGDVTFGQAPSGTKQAFPESGEAPALVSGEAYYLYVLADVGIPITRCLFSYEGP